MIYLYTGTPGSGKSLHMARDVLVKLEIRKQNVIANFEINENILKKGSGKFIAVDNCDLTVEYLVRYAMQHHKKGVEKQTLLCIDECQCLFNPREFTRADRLEWIKFFSQHRKLGYNIILVTQNDKLIDKQIRGQIEYEVRHRKVNNFKIGKLLPIPTFVGISYWYGNREKLDTEFFIYRKKLGQLYDSYKMFDIDFQAIQENAVKQNEKQKVIFKREA